MSFGRKEKMPSRQYRESDVPEVTVWGRITEKTLALLKENESVTAKELSDDELGEKIAYALRVYKDKWAGELSAAKTEEEAENLEKGKAKFLAERVEELLLS
ncbi:MAG: hypothetical protein P4L62_01050 [Candidatus Pacebacteria bacterium]|nr:hypothetical protein [Candidatus Paceibacterota bacterium]